MSPATAEAIRRPLLSAFSTAPVQPTRLPHGDCGPYHWLFADGRVAAALDFGGCGVGDPAYDLAVLTLSASDRLASVLDGYEATEEFAR